MGNCAIIGGVVKNAPYIKGDSLYVELSIYRKDLQKKEELTLQCYDKSLMKRCLKEIEEGAFFFTSNAHLETITYKRDKEFICECLYTAYETVKSERTEVIFEDFSIVNVEKGHLIEGVNKVFVSGNLCSEVNYREKDGRYYSKYKLGCNRQVYSNQAAYPYIVSFGKEAQLAHEHLVKNSRVFVTGSVQQRLVKQSKDFVCPECGARSTKKSSLIVREIIVNDVLYIDKVDFKKPGDGQAEVKED